MYLNIIIYILLFIYLTNWVVVTTFIRSIFHEKAVLRNYENTTLIDWLKSVTNIDFRFTEVVTEKYVAFMVLIPKDTIAISSRILKTFNRDELEWILLHEAAHRRYLHNIWYVLSTILQISIGVFIIQQVEMFQESVFLILLLSFVQTILENQFRRFAEYQADRFALHNMQDPNGMISGNLKFKEASTSTIYKNNLLRRLFTPHLSYDQRIGMAKKYLEA